MSEWTLEQYQYILDRMNKNERLIMNSMTELQLQRSVEEMLDQFNWLWFHDEDSRRNRSGFPDLVAVRDGTLLFIELKDMKNKMSGIQEVWEEAIWNVLALDPDTGDRVVHHLLWRPVHWYDGTIEKVLK